MRFISIAIVIAAILAAAGCARTPPGGAVSTRRLVIDVRVAGRINPNYFYYIAFDNDSDANDGPQAVVGPPWGNGWGTGTITHFMQFDDSLPQGGYGVYRIPDTTLLGKVYLGAPANFITPGPSGDTLHFVLDLDQILVAPQTSANDVQTLEINFITTDVTPNDPSFVGPRRWDALANNSSNTFIRLNVTPGRVISNTTEGIEPEGDVADPDLDIVDWSIEVQQL